MRTVLLFLLSFLLGYGQTFSQNKYVVVIHGGAGNITPENLKPEREKLYEAGLRKALLAADSVLKNGGQALDAVVAAITLMENSPLFNAGKGAVLNDRGQVEMDASIMDGKDLNAGAVAGVHHVKNPILAARAVMENSPHVLLSCKGADEFAAKQGLETADSSYFVTKRRYDSYRKLKEQKKLDKHGTVGCVVLDRYGNLAAGTSTGGMMMKSYGRVGDSPIIGAGTYADNSTCAVSCTGHGEYFIRYAVAYDITALMKYKNLTLQQAADFVINDKLKKAGGEGGIIAVDKDGNVSMTFNTKGMFRGKLIEGSSPEVFMFR